VKKPKRYDADIQALLRKHNFDGLEPSVLEPHKSKGVLLKDVFPDCADIPIGKGVVTLVEMPELLELEGEQLAMVCVVWYRQRGKDRKMLRAMPMNVILVAKECEIEDVQAETV
jgi:hypothetical protein